MLSKALGSRTVMSGSISRSKNDPSESLQMMERPLMTPDELKSIPKGSFVVMKTGTHPMQTRLRLFLDWGITFGKPYILPERAARKVAYADRASLIRSIKAQNKVEDDLEAFADAPRSEGGGAGVVVADAPIQSQPRPERYIPSNRKYNFGAGGCEAKR